MRGRELHLERARQNVDYLRKRIGAIDKKLNQYLTNEMLRGEVDEVLWLKDGSMAPLDYKFARFNGKIYQTYQTQLYCYAWLIRENYGLPVHKGFLVYTRSQNQLVEISIEDKHVAVIEKAVHQTSQIIEQNLYPKATKYKKRCVNCTYRNICIK